MEDTIQVAFRFITDVVQDGVGIKTEAFKDRLTDLITEERLKAVQAYQRGGKTIPIPSSGTVVGTSLEEHAQCWPHGGGNPQLPQ